MSSKYQNINNVLNTSICLQVFLPINITLSHWYLAVVNAKKGEIQILDSFAKDMTGCKHLRYTVQPLIYVHILL